MAKRAVIYARVSTDDQRNNYSIPSQISECLKYLEGRGYALVGNMFVDPDSGRDAAQGIAAFVDDYSSRELNRPGLDAALSFLEEYGYDVIVIHALDRLARDPYIRQTLEREIEARGARVEYALGNYDETAEGEVRKDLDATFAKWENARRVERCNRGKREKAKQGFFVCGIPPYGYKINKKQPGGLEVDETEAAVIRMAFDLYTNQGFSLYGVADELTLSGALPRYGGPWQKSTVSKMLTNTAYIGEVHYNKNRRVNKTRLEERDPEEWITISIPPILDERLFKAAQKRMEINTDLRRREPNRFYLLSGLLSCEICGKAFLCQAERAGKDRRIVDALYYRHRIRGGHCSNRYVSANRLDHIVWEKITALLLDPASLREGYALALEKENEAQRRKLHLKAELNQVIERLEARQQNLTRAYTDPEIRLSKTEYIAQRTQIQNELRDAEERLQQVTTDLSEIPTPEEYETLERFAVELRGRITSEDWNPTPENIRYILELLHVQIILNPTNGTGRITGWFGEEPGLSSIMF